MWHVDVMAGLPRLWIESWTGYLFYVLGQNNLLSSLNRVCVEPGKSRKSSNLTVGFSRSGKSCKATSGS